MLGSTQQGIPGGMHCPLYGQSQDKGGQEKSDKPNAHAVDEQQYLQMWHIHIESNLYFRNY